MSPEHIAPEVEVRNAREAHAAGSGQALNLLRELVGPYCESAWLDENGWSFMATIDGQLAGAAIGLRLDDPDRRYMLQAIEGNRLSLDSETDELMEVLNRSTPAGDLFALAVRPRFRGRGVARMLVDARLDAFRRAGIESAFAESWVNPVDANSSPVFRSMDFTELATVPRYWYNGDRSSATDDQRGCPVCGDVCVCDAILFGKML